MSAEAPMTRSVDHRVNRDWVREAVHTIEADTRRSADTHLLRIPLPAWSRWTGDDGRPAGVDLYVKGRIDPSHRLAQHRLVRSLFLYALCNG